MIDVSLKEKDERVKRIKTFNELFNEKVKIGDVEKAKELLYLLTEQCELLLSILDDLIAYFEVKG